MNVRKSIGRLPLWKALVIGFLVVTMGIFFIEKFIISRVFSIIDKSVTHFEKIAKEDKNEIDKDFDDFDERQAYEKAMYDINGTMLGTLGYPPQERNCYILLKEQKLEKLFNLSYVKKHEWLQENIKKDIASYKKELDQKVKEGLFDPNKCEGIVK